MHVLNLQGYKKIYHYIIMDCILQEDQYRTIYNTSFLSLGSSLYAVYTGCYQLSVCPLGVFITSINYWRKPDYSWRRYLDMGVVKCALLCQIYKAYGSRNMYQYYGITTGAIGFYALGVYYYKQKMYWHSTYAHCTLHILANIANLFLYSGYSIRP